MIRTFVAALSTSICIAALATPAHAQARDFAIAAGPLKAALDSYARQSGRQIIYRADEIRTLRSPGAQGRMAAEDALRAVLTGTGCIARTDVSGAVAIVRANRSSAPTAEAAPAAAEEEPAPAAPAGDIIVTALKRGTRLQDTPISISAVNGEALQDAGVKTIADLGASVPSLDFVDGGPSRRRVVIRGIQSAGEPTVGTYYDETPVTGSVGAGNDAGGSTPELRLFDVERVEVLRGPQGTLYGAGSMGGTLRVIYQKPVFKTEAAVDLGLSSTRFGGLNHEANGMVNIPIVEDKVALRAVGFYSRSHGYIDNVSLGIDDINKAKSYGGRAMLRLQPSEALTFDLAAYFNRSRTDTPLWTREAGRLNSTALARLPVKDDVDLYSATATYDLGAATLTAVGSYLKRDFFTASDVSAFLRTLDNDGYCAAISNPDGSPCSASQLADFHATIDPQTSSVILEDQTTKAWTGELRLSSTGKGPLNWTVGAFYSDRDTYAEVPQVNTDPITGRIITPRQMPTSRNINDSLRQVAVFGEVSYDIAPRLNLTVGGRYFDYRKRIVGETTIGSPIIGTVVSAPRTVRTKEDGSVLKINPSYRVSENLMVYAEAAQGFRPGGANQVIGLPTTLTPYSSDRLWNYEAGIKTNFLDRKVYLNLDVYRIDWKDMQVSGLTPDGTFVFITNAGAARVKGIEGELSIQPMRGLSINANASYSSAKLSEDQTNDNVTAAGLKGDRIPFVPKVLMGGSIAYQQPLGDALRATFRTDVRHVGSSYSDFRQQATFTRKVAAYDIVNLRIGIEAADENWSAALFLNNAFDTTSITRASSSGLELGQTGVSSATPRTIGLNLRKTF